MMPVHMFMLFYSCMSSITPPVAVAAFAAASIAGANPFRLAPYACKLAVGGFVLPFFFLFNNGVLMQGGLANIVSDTIVGAALVLTASLVLHGYIEQRPMPLWARAALAVAALVMMWPEAAVQFAAVAVAAAVFAGLKMSARRVPAQP
jgi:TRAP-type uncharacterized transport system fused permease subunit